MQTTLSSLVNKSSGLAKDTFQELRPCLPHKWPKEERVQPHQPWVNNTVQVVVQPEVVPLTKTVVPPDVAKRMATLSKKLNEIKGLKTKQADG